MALTDHPDPGTLAEHAAELPVSAEVAAHVAGCPACQADQRSLARTQEALAELGQVRMPEEVARRLDAATAGGPGATTVVPAPARRRPGLAGISAAAVLVLLVGAVTLGVVLSGRSTPSPAAGSAARAPATTSTPNRTFPVTDSGRAYTKRTLAPLVRDLVLHIAPAAATAAGGAAPGTTAPLPPARAGTANLFGTFASPAAVGACLNNIAGDASQLTPVAFDVATYNGAAAVIIVVLDPIKAALLDVYVEGPSCAHGVDSLRQYLVVPRPPGV